MLLLLGEGILLWGIIKQKIYIRYWGVLQLLYYHSQRHKCSQMLQFIPAIFMHFIQKASKEFGKGGMPNTTVSHSASPFPFYLL